MDPARADDAVSPVIGVVLMVTVTVILAAILAAYLFHLPRLCSPFPPAPVQIVAVHDYNEGGSALNYDSRVILRNMGQRLKNRPLSAVFYADGVRVDCTLATLHGEDVVPSHHFGIERVQGEGCRGGTWEPGASILIDFKDRTFMPGQTVRVDIVEDGCVISSHSVARSSVPAL